MYVTDDNTIRHKMVDIFHFLHSFIIFNKFGTVNTYLTLPLFTEVSVPSLKSDLSCICVLPFFTENTIVKRNSSIRGQLSTHNR